MTACLVFKWLYVTLPTNPVIQAPVFSVAFLKSWTSLEAPHASSAGDAGSIHAGRGAKIPQAVQPKNIKQKQYCKKFIKYFKNGPHLKKIRKKKVQWEMGRSGIRDHNIPLMNCSSFFPIILLCFSEKHNSKNQFLAVSFLQIILILGYLITVFLIMSSRFWKNSIFSSFIFLVMSSQSTELEEGIAHLHRQSHSPLVMANQVKVTFWIFTLAVRVL